MRTLMYFALTSLLLLQASCGSAPEFKEFASPEGKFAVLMPGTPQKSENKRPEMTMHTYMTESKNGAYTVAYGDWPEIDPFSFEYEVDLIAKSVNGNILSEKKEFKIDGGHPAAEFEIEIKQPAGYLSGRMILDMKGAKAIDRYYQVFAVGPKARLTDADTRKFIDSFKLTK